MLLCHWAFLPYYFYIGMVFTVSGIANNKKILYTVIYRIFGTKEETSMRKSKNSLFIAVVALASAIILSEFGLIRALRLASLDYIILHCCFIIFFQIALSVLIMVRYPMSRGKKILALSVFFFLFTALWLLLIGYRQFVAGIVCSGVVLSCITLFWDGPKKIKWRGLACAGLSFLMIVTVCLSCYLPGKIQMKKGLTIFSSNNG